MASNDTASWHRSPNGKYRCLLCTKFLSSKQRITQHLQNTHHFKQMPGSSKIPSEKQSVHCDPVLSTPKKQLNFEHFPEANKDLQSCDASSSEYKMTSSPFVHPACNNADANNSSPLNLEGFGENYSSSHDADDSSSSPLSPEGFDDNQFNFNTSFDTSDSLSECGMSDNEIESLLSDSSSEEDTVSSSESSIDTDLKTDEDIPVKEFQSLSLLSCFLRNKFSASSSQDVLQTIKDTFKECEDIARLDFNEMMTYAGTTPAREIHYCILCNEIFPENEDIFRCSTLNCEGLRYKGSLSSQQIKSRQPKQSFVFSDMKLQLKDLLQTQGISNGCDASACDSIVTHRCPSDSVLVYNSTLGTNHCCKTTYECKCDPTLCKPPRCPVGHAPQIRRYSNGKPGSCCDLYQCKIAGCWSVKGKVHKEQETWREGDCISCVCVDGKKQCQAEMCVKTCLNPTYVPGRCCPICETPRVYPNQSLSRCPDLSTCNITCETGLQLTPDGCHLCRCKPEGCYKNCRYGYLYNELGDQTCECVKHPSSCPSLTHCSKRCNHGYKLSKKGCPKCRCNKCQTFFCDKTCYLGYQRDKHGCRVCKCQESLMEHNCTVGWDVYSPGQSWHGNNCTVCTCKVDGATSCEPMLCPVLSCSILVKKMGECCPVCFNISVSHTIEEPPDTRQPHNSRSGWGNGSEQQNDSLSDMEEKYIISLSIVGTFVMILLVLVFVLLYLRLKQRHAASWSVAGQDSYCKCPLFIGHSPMLQHKYNMNGDIPNKLPYDTVAVQSKFSHPCVEVSLKSEDSLAEEEKNTFLSSDDNDGKVEKDLLSDQKTVNLKSNYSYDEWAAM